MKIVKMSFFSMVLTLPLTSSFTSASEIVTLRDSLKAYEVKIIPAITPTIIAIIDTQYPSNVEIHSRGPSKGMNGTFINQSAIVGTNQPINAPIIGGIMMSIAFSPLDNPKTASLFNIHRLFSLQYIHKVD